MRPMRLQGCVLYVCDSGYLSHLIFVTHWVSRQHPVLLAALIRVIARPPLHLFFLRLAAESYPLALTLQARRGRYLRTLAVRFLWAVHTT